MYSKMQSQWQDISYCHKFLSYNCVVKFNIVVDRSKDS